MMKRVLILFLALILLAGAGATAGTYGQKSNGAPELTLPLDKDSVKFVAIGDTGTGSKLQLELAKRMVDYREHFPYKFVIMVGDNMYGGEKPGDFEKKFEA